MAQKQWFVVPMAFGRDRIDPVPDPEGARRCEKAFRIAQRIGDGREPVWIALGADMPARYSEPFGLQTLADLSERWLINRGLEPSQIIKNAKSNNTRTELLAIREVVQCADRGDVRLRFVTSWWHAPRVWLCALIIFQRPIRVSTVCTTLSWRTLVKELPKEAMKLFLEGPCTVMSMRGACVQQRVLPISIAAAREVDPNSIQGQIKVIRDAKTKEEVTAAYKNIDKILRDMQRWAKRRRA